MHSLSTFYSIHTVFAQAKLLNLKQITTICSAYIEHPETVFAQAKLLNLKQITTPKYDIGIDSKLYLHKQSY